VRIAGSPCTLDDVKDDDALNVVIDGPGVTVETVDPRVALQVALAYLALVEQIAKERGESLGFRGLAVVPGSCALKIHTSDARTAARFSRTALAYARRSEPTSLETEPQAKKLREVLTELPQGYHVDVRILDLNDRLVAVPEPEPTAPFELTSLRATLQALGGIREGSTKATFTSHSERRAFKLRATKEQIAKLGPHIYKEMDIEVLIARDVHGVIAEGELRRFDLVDMSLDDLEAWRDWYESSGGSAWDEVEDIEAELSRDD